jgi:hypothetical protein
VKSKYSTTEAPHLVRLVLWFEMRPVGTGPFSDMSEVNEDGMLRQPRLVDGEAPWKHQSPTLASNVRGSVNEKLPESPFPGVKGKTFP